MSPKTRVGIRGSAAIELAPTTLREANAFVDRHHRHLGPVRGCICAVALAVAGEIVGVVIVGRPLARRLQDGYTAEITRLCTLGHPNACSMLSRAAWRAARALGYRRLVTYTLPSEGGGSLVAAGFKLIGEAGGGSWNRQGRPRVDLRPTQEKLRWELRAEVTA